MSLLSVEQAAPALGVSPRRLRALITSNRVPAVRVGRNWAVDQSLLWSHRRRGGGRPLSADNAWALLALLSGSQPSWVDVFSRSRLKRRLLDQHWLEQALKWSEPRAAVYSWRVLPTDLPKLQDYGLVRSGLAAQVPGLDIVPMDNDRDGYVTAKALVQIEKRFQPSKLTHNPNVVLRVPSQPWVLSQGSVVPPAVVAADLLAHPDSRVTRAGRQLLHSIAHR
jgi:excisionase family DNA binding protein